MRKIAGAIVILAGAILGAASAISAALPQAQGRSGGPGVTWSAFGGAALVGIGLAVLGSAFLIPEKP